MSIQRIDAPGIPAPVAITAVVPSTGKVGSAVSIFGKGFGVTPAQNTVSFNGGVATVTSASPTRLRVTVPAAALTGPISVTAPGGSATSSMPFRVLGPLTLAPSGASIQAGSSLQFSVAGPGGTVPSVTWAVNNIPGGNASVGTISTGGRYTAPASVPQQVLVTVTATDQSDTTSTGSAPVIVVPVGTQRFAAANGVSVSVGSGPIVFNSLQTSVSAWIGGPAVINSLQTSVSARIGGEPSAIAVTTVSVSLSPVITSVSPATGARGATGLAVTLTGAGFNNASQVIFLSDNVPDTTISPSLVSISPDGTQATLQVSISSGASTGARVVEIATPTGPSTVVGTGANTFSR